MQGIFLSSESKSCQTLKKLTVYESSEISTNIVEIWL